MVIDQGKSRGGDGCHKGFLYISIHPTRTTARQVAGLALPCSRPLLARLVGGAVSGCHGGPRARGEALGECECKREGLVFATTGHPEHAGPGLAQRQSRQAPD